MKAIDVLGDKHAFLTVKDHVFLKFQQHLVSNVRSIFLDKITKAMYPVPLLFRMFSEVGSCCHVFWSLYVRVRFCPKSALTTKRWNPTSS